MEFHFIEMSKLLNDWKNNKLDPWNDVLARWLLLLGMVDHRNDEIHDKIFKELEGIAMKDKVLKDAFKSWEEMSLTQEQKLAYEARLKKVLDEESAVREAELRVEEGIQKGIAIGKEAGMKKGIEMGKEKVARQLLADGMDIEEVARVTGLEEDRIKGI